jgi:hypothetical protein
MSSSWNLNINVIKGLSGQGRKRFLLFELIGKVKVKFSLEQSMKVQKRSRGITVLFNLGVRWRWVINTMPQPLHTLERDLLPVLQEAGQTPEPVWASEKNLARTGIRFPDCPVCSESLHQLHRAHRCCCFCIKDPRVCLSSGQIG